MPKGITRRQRDGNAERTRQRDAPAERTPHGCVSSYFVWEATEKKRKDLFCKATTEAALS